MSNQNIPSKEQIEAWTNEERNRVARLLHETAPRSASRSTRRRALIIAITALGALLLIPWTVYLNDSLPAKITSHGWRLAWVGYDVGLTLIFALTAWLVLHRRQLSVILLTIAATLLTVDAWFDVTLSWSTNEQGASLLTAVILEIPIALFLLAAGLFVLRRIIATVETLRGRSAASFSLWSAPTVFISSNSHLKSNKKQ